MKKFLLPLILLASALPGCGPGLDTDSFHPGSVDGALLWYKAEQAYLNGNTWYWAESLGNQAGLSFTGQVNPSIFLGSQGQKLLGFSPGVYFSRVDSASLSLAEFTVYAVAQSNGTGTGGVFGVLSTSVSASACGSGNIALRWSKGPAEIQGEVMRGAGGTPISVKLTASTGLSVIELRYSADGTLRLQAAGQSSWSSGSYSTISIASPNYSLGAACVDSAQVALGNLDLGEVLFYNRAVSDSESLRIRRYLMLRHGVTQ